jgi:hypothetical protein
MKSLKITGYLAVICCGLLLGVGGCTKKPSADDITRLEEAKAAAESAERKLAELRSERMALETQVQVKEAELKKNEEERDALKQGAGK